MITGLPLVLTDTVAVSLPGRRVSTSGTPVADWANPIQVGTFQAAVQGLTTTEELGERDGSRSRYRVFMFPDAPVTRSSRLAWRGKTLEIVGEPRTTYIHTENQAHHLELDAKEVNG